MLIMSRDLFSKAATRTRCRVHGRTGASSQSRCSCTPSSSPTTRTPKSRLRVYRGKRDGVSTVWNNSLRRLLRKASLVSFSSVFLSPAKRWITIFCLIIHPLNKLLGWKRNTSGRRGWTRHSRYQKTSESVSVTVHRLRRLSLRVH